MKNNLPVRMALMTAIKALKEQVMSMQECLRRMDEDKGVSLPTLYPYSPGSNYKETKKEKTDESE